MRRAGHVLLGLLAMALLLAAALWMAPGEPARAPASQDEEQDSGGVLLPEQAAYDVTFYDLALDVDPEAERIAGTLTAHAAVEQPLRQFVLDLDDRLEVEHAAVGQNGRFVPAAFERRPDQVWIELPRTYAAGDSVRVRVRYGGAPRVAPNPPWEGGFTWARTDSGHPWIATSCQTVGADIWWPVKDHPSDEPDSMALRFTVPRPLVAASNGRLRRVEEGEDARTYHWFVSTPINTYAVALHAAPYDTVRAGYTSTAGRPLPLTFWVLPADTARARRALPGFIEQVRFLEETLGPYPFRADKLGIAHVPFLGMEHQTLIAYGHDFTAGGLGYDLGFDALFLHELAHEWFGNLVTASDWKDFWLHEGFATYVEALYAEHVRGAQGYRTVMEHIRQNAREGAIAYREPRTAKQMYDRNVYFKGALVLHVLRRAVGEDAFFELLRRTAYPDAAHRQATGGAQARSLTTGGFIRLAEEVAGRELTPFFERYVYGAALPALSFAGE